MVAALASRPRSRVLPVVRRGEKRAHERLGGRRHLDVRRWAERVEPFDGRGMGALQVRFVREGEASRLDRHSLLGNALDETDYVPAELSLDDACVARAHQRKGPLRKV